jgi:ABC-type Zn uptake system ZnuABC Zn-binding protein ZnuA
LLLVLAGALPACTSTSTPEDAHGPVRVAVTTTVLADFVRIVAGEELRQGRVHVDRLLRPNVEPHDFEPSARDLVAVARADVLLANGAGLETFLGKLIRSAEPRVPVDEASRGIRLRNGANDPHDPGHAGVDPHIWHDPTNAVVMVRNVAAALSRVDRGAARVYRRNADRYVAALRRLDRWIRQRTADLRHRALVTNHDALGYYADRYRLHVIGAVIPSFDSSAEVSAYDVDHLVATIHSQRAGAVFAEPAQPSVQAEAVAAAAGVPVVTGAASIYTDGLGPSGSGADTYLRMMRHNTDAIVAALR